MPDPQHVKSNQSLFQVTSNFEPAGDQPAAINKLFQGISSGLSHQTLLGVTGSGKTFTMAHLVAKLQRPTVVLAPNKTLAAQLYSEFKRFFPNNSVEYFVSYYDYYQPEAYVPSSDTFIEKDASINDHIEQMRLSATKALLERNDAIIVASVSAIYGLGDPQSYLTMILHLDRGDIMSQRDVVLRLSELQYTRNDMDFKRGTFRVRGDVIDVFPAESEENALRIELFDDEVEGLSIFDPLTGHVLQKVDRFTVYPKTHYVTPKDVVRGAIDTIRAELKERVAWFEKNNKLLEAQRINQRTKYDLEMLQELGYCNGIENYSRHFSGRADGAAPPTLFDYLPADALLVVDESHVTVPQLGAMYRGDRARKQTLVEHGFRLPTALDNRPMKFEEFEAIAPQMVFVSATPGPYEMQWSSQTVEQVVRPTGLVDPLVEVRPASTQVDDVLSEITQCIAQQQRVLITVLTKRMAEDLSEYLAEKDYKVRYLHSDIDTVERVEIIRDLRLGAFDVLVGINLLREGLDMPEVALVAIFDADKEGFLRSERSLIQTIGRAARNLHGRAILYGDKVTKSMQKAIDETDRRREKQAAHNKANGITPKGVISSLQDILEGSYVPGKKKTGRADKRQATDSDHAQITSESDIKDIAKEIKRLENRMLDHAKNLEFEKAAQVRDEVKQLSKFLLLGESAS